MAFGFVRRHPAWTWIGLVLLLTAILVLVYIPRTIQWGLERWLEKQGRISAEIDDVDFNPFTGRLVVHTLLAEREEGPGRIQSERLALNIEWWPLTRKRLLFEQMTVSDAIVTVRKSGETWFIGGLRIAAGEEKEKTESAWRFGFGGIDLRNVKVIYLDGDLRQELVIEEAHLDSMQGWNPEQMGRYSLRLRAAGAPITLTGQARPFAEQPVVEGRLETSGFPLAWLQPWLTDGDAQIDQGQLSAALDLSSRILPEEGRLRLTFDGSLSLVDLQASLPGYRVERGTFSWQGHLELAAPRPEQPPLLTAAGTISSPGVTLYLDQPAIRLSAGQLSVEEDFAMGTAEVPAGADFLLRLQGNAGPLQAVASERQLTLAAIEKLSFSGLRLAGRDLAVEKLSATDLRLLQRPDAGAKEPAHYLAVQRLLLENGAGSPAGPLQVGAIRLQGVRGVLVRDASGELDLAPWSFAGGEPEAKAAAAEPQETTFPAIRVGLLEIGGENRLRYVDRSVKPTVTVTIAPLQARLENLDTAAAPDTGPVSFDVKLQANGHPLSAQGTARPFAEPVTLASQVKVSNWPLPLVAPYLPDIQARQGTASVDGKLELTYAPDSERFSAELNGSVGLANVRAAAPETVVRGGSAAFQGTSTVAGGGGSSDVRLRGTLRLTDISGDFGGVGLNDSSATLNGHLGIATAPAPAKPQIEVGGNLQIPLLNLTFPDSPLALQARQGRLQGSFALNTPAVPAEAPFLVSVSGRTGLLRVADRNRNLDLFAAEAVEAEKLRVTGPQTISAVKVDIRAPRALERRGETKGEQLTHMAAAASLSASGLRLAEPNRLQFSELRLPGLQLMVVRDKHENFDFGAWPQELQDGADEPPPPGGAEKPWQVRAGLLAIEGGSRLLYHDFSVDPAVRLELQPFSVRVDNLDTAAATPSPFRIEGSFGQYTPLRAEGTLTAVGPPPTLAGTAELQGFDLPKVTGYVEKYAGHTVRSGQLDLELEGKLVAGNVQAEATAILTQLNLEPLATAERAETERQLGFPLNTGLNLLRDKQGTITLDFPITGDIRSPEVGLAGIVRTAVFKAMRGATFSYLANLGATALGAPVGASFLARRIFERFTAVRFRPVAFAPGVAELDPGNRDYLKEIAAKLEDRPEITIVLCGVATTGDAMAMPPPATEEELRQLAQLRSERVKEALVELGIAAGRLVLCAPEVLEDEAGGPRVEVGI